MFIYIAVFMNDAASALTASVHPAVPASPLARGGRHP